MRPLNWKSLVQEGENLGNKTFYRIGGEAEFFADVESVEEISFLIHAAKQRGLPWRVMGSGTNLVIQSGTLKGLTFRLARKSFNQINFDGKLYSVGTSAMYPALVRKAIEEGFESAASLGGIPGTVGGALIMNAGGHHGEIGDFVQSVSGFDSEGCEKTWVPDECGFSYRHSDLKGALVLSCILDFGMPTEGAKEKFSEWVRWKSDTQPTGSRSAGCMFKNPEGYSAGRLIDLSGFKGQRDGDIEVSEQHANFLVNHGQGTFEQVKNMITRIKEKVLSDHGVTLEAEVEIWENA